MAENNSVQKTQIDVAALMADIRARVKETNSQIKRKDFAPRQAQDLCQRKAGELLHSEELRYLNHNYAFGPNLNLDAITSHRPGLIGKIIVKFKQKFLNLIWSLLKDYFARERDFQSNLVRYLNDVSKYVDARDASNFWELVRKVDVDVTKALERIEIISDEMMASLRSSERRLQDTNNQAIKNLSANIAADQAQLHQQAAMLQSLDGVCRGLEGIVSLAGKQGKTISEIPDQSYVLLENRFRGSEELIGDRLKIYPEVFKGIDGKVLEIGPGRGELQKLFREAKIESFGIDYDSAMVEICKSQGFDVRHGDGIAEIAKLEDQSLAGVIAIQVVEHLTSNQLQNLLSLCRQKVKPGGKIVFETINPKSMLALSSNYFRDPTHVFPQHPDTLAYQLTLSGLEVLEVKYLSPVSKEALLKKLPETAYVTPQWAQLLETLNANIDQLNDLLFGYQDYCVIAKV